eukprot:1892094-Pleurochrysis_carterae.AAC.1
MVKVHSTPTGDSLTLSPGLYLPGRGQQAVNIIVCFKGLANMTLAIHMHSLSVRKLDIVQQDGLALD